jgi:hypothetical protein
VRFSLIVALCWIVTPSVVPAQSNSRFVVDAALGGTVLRGGNEYMSRGKLVGLLAGTAIASTHVAGARPFIQFAFDRYSGGSHEKCAIASFSGSCQDSPNFTGCTAVAGLRWAVGPTATMSAFAGSGWYRADMIAASGSRGLVLGGDGALRMSNDVAITVRWQHVELPEVGGRRMTLAPVLAGMRLSL